MDSAPGILKRDISRIKKLLLDPNAILPLPIVSFTLQEAKGTLDLLRLHALQLNHWQHETITEAERAEVTRLQAAVPEIRPLIQRLITLATELERRAMSGGTPTRKKWRHH